MFVRGRCTSSRSSSITLLTKASPWIQRSSVTICAWGGGEGGRGDEGGGGGGGGGVALCPLRLSCRRHQGSARAFQRGSRSSCKRRVTQHVRTQGVCSCVCGSTHRIVSPMCWHIISIALSGNLSAACSWNSAMAPVGWGGRGGGGARPPPAARGGGLVWGLVFCL